MEIVGKASSLRATDRYEKILGSLADAFSTIQKENFMVTNVVMSRKSYNIFLKSARYTTDICLLNGKRYLWGALISTHKKAKSIYCFKNQSLEIYKKFPELKNKLQ